MVNIIETVKQVISQSAYYNTPRYRDSVSLRDLPILDKNKVIENYNVILSNTSKMIFRKTSGSTGIPLEIAWNYDDYMQSMLTLWRLRKQHGITSSDFFLTCHAAGMDHSGYLDSSVIVTTNSLSLSKLCYSNDIMNHYISQIKIFRPKWIYAQPSFVYWLGLYLYQHAPELSGLFTYVELVGEQLDPEIKNSIATFFPNAIVVNMYGLQEFNGVMYEDNGVMCAIDDNVFIEILREDGSECDVNEEGNIVITGLKNTSFPLIRYNTGDRAKKIDCGEKKGYLITMGRSNDNFVCGDRLYDGSLFFVVVSIYNNSHDKKIAKFQVIYDQNTFVFTVFSFDAPLSMGEMKNDLRSILRQFIVGDWDIKVQEMNETNLLSNSKKIKYFINKSHLLR